MSVFYSLARCSHKIGKADETVEFMGRYLSLKYNLTNMQVIDEVKCVLAGAYDIVSSEYHYLGGTYNCGFIETVAIEKHSKITKALMTKLVEGEQNRDETFYRIVYPLVETLHPMIPKLIDLRSLHGLTLLTTEKIEGSTPSEEDFDIVLEASKVIEAIPYEQTTAIFNTLDTNIHERSFISKWSLKQSYWKTYLTLASKIDNPERIYATFTRLYRMLLDIKIFQLATAANYCFCHGDFHKRNIFVQDGAIKIIDWANYRVAPLGYDIEKYFHALQNPLPDFTAIQQQYLDQRFPLCGGTRQNAVSILLFIHNNTFWRAIRSKPAELEAGYESFFLPAVEYAIEIASRYLGYREAGQKAFTR